MTKNTQVKACAFAVAALPEDAQQAAIALVEAASIAPDGVGAFAQVLQKEAVAAADADQDRRRAWRPLAAWRASRTLFAPSFDEAAARRGVRVTLRHRRDASCAASTASRRTRVERHRRDVAPRGGRESNACRLVDGVRSHRS